MATANKACTGQMGRFAVATLRVKHFAHAWLRAASRPAPKQSLLPPTCQYPAKSMRGVRKLLARFVIRGGYIKSRTDLNV